VRRATIVAAAEYDSLDAMVKATERNGRDQEEVAL
jgi:hypothetical protein